MSKARQYEDEIIKTVRAMPDDALPKVLQVVERVRQEFLASQQNSQKPSDGLSTASHEHTRNLIASCKGNWAQELRAERDDRL